MPQKRKGVGALRSGKRAAQGTRIAGARQETKGAVGRRQMRDDELSGDESGSSDGEGGGAQPLSGSEDEAEDAYAGETVDETRLRLAKQYLATVAQEAQVAEEDADDDAFTFNQDAIAHRLQQDVSEAKGRQYRRVADKMAAALPDTDGHRFLRGHKLPLTAVALSGDDSLCFSASKDGQVLQWDVESGAKTRIWPSDAKHGASIHALAASQDGKYVAMAGKDQLVHVYDVRQRSVANSFKGHRDAVSCLAFRRNTHQLFSGSLDRTIKVWNLDEMCYVETLFGHQDQITGLAALMRERCVTMTYLPAHTCMHAHPHEHTLTHAPAQVLDIEPRPHQPPLENRRGKSSDFAGAFGVDRLRGHVFRRVVLCGVARWRFQPLV